MAAMTETSAKEVIEATDAAATGDACRSGEVRAHNATSAAKEKESGNETSRRSEASENGKKKAKEEKPPTKVVIRRLPPSMTKDVFLDQISPVPDHDYFYYVQGDPAAGALMGFSRAYINFINQEDLFQFTETYDNYVFVDNKGQEYPAMVEFSLFQRIPKQRTKKKDHLAGSIETNPDFTTFKECLEAAAAEAAKPDVTSKQHFFETEVTSSAPQEETTTPLLEFLKQKKADRARIRDERREEKKRKEAERKLRLKASKERKEVEEEPKEIKKNPDPPSCRGDPISVNRIPVKSSSDEKNVKFSKSQLKKSDSIQLLNRLPRAEPSNTDSSKFGLDEPDRKSNEFGQCQKGSGRFKYRSRHFSNKLNKRLKNGDGNSSESEVKAKQQTALLRQMLKLSDGRDNGIDGSIPRPKSLPASSPARKSPLLPTPRKGPPFGFGRNDFPALKSSTKQYLTYNFCKGSENQNQSRRYDLP